MPEEKLLPYSHRKRSGSETRKRGNVFTFRVLPEERKLVEARAEVKGLTLGSYIRSVILPDSKTPSKRKPRADVAALARTMMKLSKIGSNIAQILKAVNFKEPYDRQLLEEVSKELLETLKEVRQAIRPQAKWD